jgi:hypothetical protein
MRGSSMRAWACAWSFAAAALLWQWPARAAADCDALAADGRALDGDEAALAQTGAQIAARKREVAGEISAFNTSCGSSNAPGCDAQRRTLAAHQGEVDAAIARYRDVKKQLDARRAALRERTTACAPLPKVDPCAYFDADARSHAARELARLEAVRKKLGDKLDEVKRWRGELTRTRDDYERLRDVSAAAELAEAMSAVPIDRVLAGLARQPRLAAALGDKVVGELVAAWRSAQTALAAMQLARTPSDDTSAQLKQTLSATRRAHEAMLAVPAATLPHDARGEATRGVLKGAGHAFAVATKLLSYAGDDRPRPSGEAAVRYEREGKLLVECAAIFEWPVALALGVEEVAQLETRRAVGRAAVERLQSVIAGNWDAERYLRAKVEQLDTNIGELTRITKCGQQ